MNARRFFLIAAGLLMLTIAYSLGASKVQGQAPNPTVASVINLPGNGQGDGYAWVFTTNGDMYETRLNSTAGGGSGATTTNHVFVGNIFMLGPATDARQPPASKTWSEVKREFKK